MSTAEERLKILNMVSEGKISADEASALLKALKQSQPSESKQTGSSPPPSTLRVRVLSQETGQVRVNVSIPFSLVDVGMRLGAKYAPDLEGVDFQQVMTAVRSGARGKIIEATDGGEIVEIYAE